jgi:Flp pilus assembly protein TadD
MKRTYFVFILSCLAFSLFSQNGDVENWRRLGYIAKTEADYTTAIGYYQRILDTDPEDYDAKLALARLFIVTENYGRSIDLFDEIYRNDTTDVEALNGLGTCYEQLGKNKLSVFYFEKALNYLPDDIRQCFYLAKAYGNNGDLDKAIETYRYIIRLDETWSEAWAGIGKMYYWNGQPNHALVFYEKALELDPENAEILKEYKAVQNELYYVVTLQVGPVNEIEDSYEINAMISKITFDKRINDRYEVQATTLIDYSNRNYTADEADTTRWYDNTRIKGKWISPRHSVEAYGGYSNTDNKFSSYGLAWKLNYSPGQVGVKNSLQAGYDYFYYWNKVGSTSVSDELGLTYRFIGLGAKYAYGVIDAVYVRDYKTGDSVGVKQNPFQAYGISLDFKVLKRPEIKVGMSHSYLNYEYKSPLYYSPYGRNLTGALISVYYNISRFYLYGHFDYNLGTELTYEEANSGKIKEEKLNVDNWAANVELGYDYHPLSLSIGGNYFYNPYYQSITGFIAVKVLF